MGTLSSNDVYFVVRAIETYTFFPVETNFKKMIRILILKALNTRGKNSRDYFSILIPEVKYVIFVLIGALMDFLKISLAVVDQ